MRKAHPILEDDTDKSEIVHSRARLAPERACRHFTPSLSATLPLRARSASDRQGAGCPSSSSFHPSVSEVDCAPLAQLTTRSRRDGLRADHNDSTVGDMIPISIMFRVIADVLAVRDRDAFVENGFTNLAA